MPTFESGNFFTVKFCLFNLLQFSCPRPSLRSVTGSISREVECGVNIFVI